jgi:hypothetical protein
MIPIDAEESFLERLDGSFALGFDSEKSSDVTTLRTTADINYRTRQYLVGLQATVNNTTQAEDETRNRTNIRGNYQRFRDNRWFTDWFTGWERHDELGIQSRVSGGGALGRYLVQNNRNQLSLTGGLNITSTDFTGDDPSTETVEGRIQVRYLHRNLDPEAKPFLRYHSIAFVYHQPTDGRQQDRLHPDYVHRLFLVSRPSFG